MTALTIILYFWQSLALLISVVKRKVNSEGLQKYFFYFLCFVIFMEALAQILIHVEKAYYYVYNISNTLSFLFYFFWYHSYLKNKIVVWLSLLFVGITLADLLVSDFISSILMISFFSGAIILLILAIWYFISLLKAEEAIYFYKIQAFWISTGILIYHIGVLPILILIKLPGYNQTHLRFALMILNFLLYGLIALGLVCPKRK